MLKSVIISAGEDCKEVLESFYQGPYKGGALWNARCLGGRTWAGTINNDATGSVLDCTVLKRVAQVECFVRLP